MIGRGAWGHPNQGILSLLHPHSGIGEYLGLGVSRRAHVRLRERLAGKIDLYVLADRNFSVWGVFEHALYSSSPPFLPQRIQKERNCSVISVTDGRRPSRLWKASRKAM